MGNSTLENSWQQIDPADVTDRAESQGLQILASVTDNKVLSDVTVLPPIVTPNGDGINDVTTFDFTVRRLSGAQPVDVQVFDLSGLLVRTLSVQRSTVAGTYSVEWLADDDRGQVVPPGIYILRIDVETDSNSDVKQTGVQRLLYVAY